MSRIHTPDKWALLRLSYPGHEPIIKVMGSWYGGFTHGNSWRLSSGVVRIERNGDVLDIHNHSGSIYRVNVHAEGTSGYTESVIATFPAGVKVERLTLDEAQAALKGE